MSSAFPTALPDSCHPNNYLLFIHQWANSSTSSDILQTNNPSTKNPWRNRPRPPGSTSPPPRPPRPCHVPAARVSSPPPGSRPHRPGLVPAARVSPPGSRPWGPGLPARSPRVGSPAPARPASVRRPRSQGNGKWNRMRARAHAASISEN